MLDSFFSKDESDLDGYHFKREFEKATNKELLDVRTPAEFQSGNIPGSINLDVMSPNFVHEMEKLDKSKTYFVYCRSGNRSGNAVNMMKKAGFNAFNLIGGIGAWPR
ncbi:MAG: rhodanese-like domain-containing protein [Sphingobacteriales bacterium]|nr:rhodanese-like domain-containing protein [Sphingobacteriales bacterium]